MFGPVVRCDKGRPFCLEQLVQDSGLTSYADL